MSDTLPGFVPVLQRQGIVTAEQVREAQAVVTASGGRWEEVLVRLGFATADEVLLAWAEVLHLRVIDLPEMTLAPAILELVPESVARENVVLPVTREGRLLVLAMCTPWDADLVDRLTFILNQPIQLVLASREQILEAINRHYGQTETESVDSMLAEFTDTAIDFTESDDEELEEAPLALDECDEDEEAPTMAARAEMPSRRRAPGQAAGSVERRATVRYYERMNPERLYPLLVVLSKAEIEKVAQANVGQKQSKSFQVQAGSVVEIEPILPGCDCYPQRVQATVTGGEVRAEFWVAPRVLGTIQAARVIVRQEGKTLAEVPLEARVTRQIVTWIMAGLSCVLPFLLLILKHFRLDFDSQREQGYGVYAQLAGWVVASLTPEWLTVLLLVATLALYFLMRPRQRDLFWDIKPVAESPDRPEAKPEAENPRETLRSHLAAIRRGDRRPELYFRAALAARRQGDTVQALVILRRAEMDLPPAQMTKNLWYNMACYAALLGQEQAALKYLEKAIAAGFHNVEKIRTDPDLASLRHTGPFQRLLAGQSMRG
jgi:hypothetical protein